MENQREETGHDDNLSRNSRQKERMPNSEGMPGRGGGKKEDIGRSSPYISQFCEGDVTTECRRKQIKKKGLRNQSVLESTKY